MNPSKTRIKQILRDCAFDPRRPGPLAIITEVGTRDYYECRAIELIREAQLGNHKESLQKAIALLALAIALEA